MSEINDIMKLLNEEEDKGSKLSLQEIVSIVKNYFMALWSKKWLVVAAGIIGGIIGLIYAYNRQTTYAAQYTFTIGGSSSSSPSINGLSSLLNLGGNSMDAFSGDNVLELIKSYALVEKTLLSPVEYNGDSINFIEYALICDSVRANCEKEKMKEKDPDDVSICDITFPLGQERQTFTRAQDSILHNMADALLTKNISAVRKDKKLSFMIYTFAHNNEEFTKEFSAAHLREVSKFYIDTKTSLARKNIETFQGKADSVRQKLDQCFTRRARFADENRNANGQMISVTQWKLDTDIQILSNTYTEMLKNLEVLKLNLAKETPFIQVIDEPRYPLANDKMRKLKGVITGGFLGGFLACLAIIAYCFIGEMKEKMLAGKE